MNMKTKTEGTYFEVVNDSMCTKRIRMKFKTYTGPCTVSFPSSIDLGQLVRSLAEANRTFDTIGQLASHLAGNIFNHIGASGDERWLSTLKEIERITADGKSYIAATGMPV